MRRTSYNQKGNLWFGLAKSILFITILFLGSLLFYSSFKYFDLSYNSGYFSGKNPETLPLFRIAVITHLVSATLILVLASVQILFRFEIKKPALHRKIGILSIFSGLFFLVPTGFYLSTHAMGGIPGKIIFFCLSSLTLVSLINGYRFAVKRSIHMHRVWMIRFYIFLTSALWLRLNMLWIFLSFGNGEWQYITASILSWVPQLIIFEIFKKKL
jgi:hypothetical protein